MSDQCKNCTLRGDYEACIKTECFHHENWINVERIKRINSLERQLAEAREERDYLARGVQVRDTMIKSLQEECVKLHLQIPIKPFSVELKEQGDD